MKWWIALFLMASVPVRAATIHAASVALADVNAAVASAVTGDTVIIPSGTAIWTSGLVFAGKGITLQGSGTNSTIIIDEVSPRSNSMIHMTWTNLTGLLRLTNLQIRGGTTNIASNSNGIIKIVGSNYTNNNSAWRIDRIHFDDPKGRPIGAYAWSGLIDTCYINAKGSAGLSIDGRTPDTSNKGDVSWITPVYWGTTNSGVYIEACVITNTSLRAITDSFAGGRYVFRFNTCDNVAVENHGLDTTGRARSCRSFEAYGNTLATSIASEFAVLTRGGTAIVFSNHVSGSFPGLMRMVNYRNTYKSFPWGQANGTNVWDQNDATLYASGTHDGGDSTVLTDSTQSWSVNQWVGYSIQNMTANLAGMVSSSTATTITCAPPKETVDQIRWTNGHLYEIRRVIRAIDQPGVGLGDLLSGGSDTVPPTPTTWPNQIDEPIHFWANTGITNVTNDGYYNIVEGRNYTNAVLSGYTPLTFPHPLALVGEISSTTAPSRLRYQLRRR